MAGAPGWTTEQDTQLTSLWGQVNPQLSTAEIGRRLGKSKNAVIGRARRLALAQRISPLTVGGNVALRKAQGRE